MKKFFKSLSIICLALVLLCPLALVGCDKNYTINIEVAQGAEGGFVYLKDVEGISVVGNTTVKSGEKFEYYVSPKNGYKISKVVVDGKEQTGFRDSGAYFYLEDIEKDHKIKVYFEAKKYEVNFYCLTAGGVYELFNTVEVSYGSSIDLNQASYGGAIALWYKKINNQDVYLYNNSTDINAPKENITPGNLEGIESNILFVHGEQNVYCNKTAAELLSMGVTR